MGGRTEEDGWHDFSMLCRLYDIHEISLFIVLSTGIRRFHRPEHKFSKGLKEVNAMIKIPKYFRFLYILSSRSSSRKKAKITVLENSHLTYSVGFISK